MITWSGWPGQSAPARIPGPSGPRPTGRCWQHLPGLPPGLGAAQSGEPQGGGGRAPRAALATGSGPPPLREASSLFRCCRCSLLGLTPAPQPSEHLSLLLPSHPLLCGFPRLSTLLLGPSLGRGSGSGCGRPGGKGWGLGEFARPLRASVPPSVKWSCWCVWRGDDRS